MVHIKLCYPAFQVRGDLSKIVTSNMIRARNITFCTDLQQKVAVAMTNVGHIAEKMMIQRDGDGVTQQKE